MQIVPNIGIICESYGLQTVADIAIAADSMRAPDFTIRKKG